MREALDDRHGGNRAAWHAAFAGLVPEAVKAGAAAATTASALVMGGIAMKATAGVLSAIVIVSLMWWVGSSGSKDALPPVRIERSEAAETGSRPAAEKANASHLAPRAIGVLAEDAAADPALAASSPTGELRVLVVAKDSGTPVAGARVKMWDTSNVPRAGLGRTSS